MLRKGYNFSFLFIVCTIILSSLLFSDTLAVTTTEASIVKFNEQEKIMTLVHSIQEALNNPCDINLEAVINMIPADSRKEAAEKILDLSAKSNTEKGSNDHITNHEYLLKTNDIVTESDIIKVKMTILHDIAGFTAQQDIVLKFENQNNKPILFNFNQVLEEIKEFGTYAIATLNRFVNKEKSTLIQKSHSVSDYQSDYLFIPKELYGGSSVSFPVK